MNRSLIAMVVGLCAVAMFTAVPAAAQSKVGRPAAAGTSVWVVGSPTSSFADQLVSTMDPSASSAPAIEVVQGLLSVARSGNTLNLPGPALTPPQAADQLAALSALLHNKSGLAAKQRALHTSADRFVAGTSAVTPDLSIASQRGSATNSNRSWVFNTEIAAHMCNPGGCGPDTDDIKQRWTMDPGRTADKFSFTSVYFPTTGAFVNIFAHAYSFCGSNLTLPGCGNTIYPPSGPRNGNGNGSFFVKHTSNAGNSLREEVDQTAHFSPTNSTAVDTASTGRAICNTGTDTSCPYL